MRLGLAGAVLVVPSVPAVAGQASPDISHRLV